MRKTGDPFGAISFVQQFYDKTYPEAVTMLLGRDGQGIIPIVKKEPESREPKPFTLPEAYLNMRRLYAYLTTHRRIDRDVVTAFVREKDVYKRQSLHLRQYLPLRMGAAGIPRQHRISGHPAALAREKRRNAAALLPAGVPRRGGQEIGRAHV